MLRIALTVLCLLGAVPGLAAEPRAPDGLVLDYRILRNGSEIGRHRVEFSHTGEGLTVSTRIRIAYKFLFITLYRFELDAVETWQGGRLIALDSTTDDNGERYSVRAVADGTGVGISGARGEWTAAADIAPSSLWHRDMVEREVLLNVRYGDALAVGFAELGRETVPARGGEVTATHYRVSGDLERELWYDADGLLVRTRFEADDGSEIDYVLQ